MKKWCDYCKINLPYSKKEILEHEQTRIHLENKRKEIAHLSRQAKIKDRIKEEERRANVLLGGDLIPKAKRGSQLQKQVQQHRQNVMDQGRSAIHRLIAEKTQGMYGAPIEFPEKEELVLKENYVQQQDEDMEMWRVDICETTGDACFINNVTQTKLYEPPGGYILSEAQREQWEYTQQLCKDKVALHGDDTVSISQWEVVADEDNYFQLHAVPEQSLSEEQKPQLTSKNNPINAVIKVEEGTEKAKASWLEELEAKVEANRTNANEVFQTVIYNKLLQCRNVREQNDTLKKLVLSDFQIRRTNEDRFAQIKLEDEPQCVSFKPKKKLKTVNISSDL